jgi:hypothetical protein
MKKMFKLDKILFEANYPVLFTCVNEKQELFLGVCCQNNAEGMKWLLTKTDEQNIVELLEDKISIREAFLRNPESQITIFWRNDVEAGGYKKEVTEHLESDWGEDSIYLPKKGEYLDADPGEFDEEIAYYRSRLLKSYNMPFGKVQIFKYNIVIDRGQFSTHLEDYCDVVIGEKIYSESWYKMRLTHDLKGEIIYSDNTQLEKTTCYAAV